ncbi:hypothetical protein BASA60_005434 [Batrachochytrium salamandrivorans]|nr:hypothetical protein BASA60_005434 [Batrachochytrium salamandrivorans]
MPETQASKAGNESGGSSSDCYESYDDEAQAPGIDVVSSADVLMDSLLKAALDDECFSTETSESQLQVEDLVLSLIRSFPAPERPLLLRSRHIPFLEQPFNGLSKWWVALDASKPWLIMWMLHSLDLLGVDIPVSIKERAISSLSACQHSSGGYGGGPGQIAHLATTYAAVNAIAIIGTPEAYQSINRELLYSFLLAMKQVDGSYCMHHGGEIDVRGTYCAVNAAQLVGILSAELVDRAGEFIVRCQTYEGGIGAIPGVEAHGGYSYCAVAAMEIIGKMDMLDIDALTAWVCARQMPLEGGFNGRTNKLVDGCYSFWQGGIVSLIEMHRSKKLGRQVNIFNHDALQKYILICCQGEHGGLRDKPGKSPDYYHSCYCLSGLSVSQHVYQNADNEIIALPRTSILGPPGNLLHPTHPTHNIRMERAKEIKAFF